MNSRLALAAATLSLSLFAEDRAPIPAGAQVEVALTDGNKAVASLIAYKDGVLTLRSDKGVAEIKQETVKSVRFLGMPPQMQHFQPQHFDGPRNFGDREPRDRFSNPGDGGPGGPGERRRHDGPDRLGPRREPPPPGDMKRLRQLSDMDKAGNLADGEVDEMFKLRERLPLMPGFQDSIGGKFQRFKFAEEQAEHEAVKRRLPRIVDMLRRKLAIADDEGEARDALMMLTQAYKHQKVGLQNGADQIHNDIQSIKHAPLRERLLNLINDGLGLGLEPRRRDP